MNIKLSARVRHALLLIALASGACATTPQPQPAKAAPKLPSAVLWMRRSAEHRALLLQTYRTASEKLGELARGLGPQTWAVILDADETIWDNTLFEERRLERREVYSDSAWESFMMAQVSVALPGAVDFLTHVHALGGRVVIVTGRADAFCDATRGNLRKVGLQADLVLCRSTSSDDKNPRFRAVQEGTAKPGWQPLRVLMWLGDNIQDFPGLTQVVRTFPDSAFAHFGRDYFIMPNPLYGSWQANN